ncbi:hypothetical protein C8J56DRAFT_1130883 [Mycena floridula]|nr:hypothetical protein C8J56DRAFT_1130883 [Mycena floridula]
MTRWNFFVVLCLWLHRQSSFQNCRFWNLSGLRGNSEGLSMDRKVRNVQLLQCYMVEMDWIPVSMNQRCAAEFEIVLYDIERSGKVRRHGKYIDLLLSSYLGIHELNIGNADPKQ